jgi:hypothetical protein
MRTLDIGKLLLKLEKGQPRRLKGFKPTELKTGFS